MKRRRDGVNAAMGFTLIEVVVVMLILTIILGMVGVRLTRDQGDTIRDEARRLASAMQSAQQQAILEGRPFAFQLTEEGYNFLQLGKKDRLVPIENDELLAPRVLPRALTLKPLKPREAGKKRTDLVVFDPSGEFSPFTMVFAIDEIKWYVQGSSDGQISAKPSIDAAAS